MLDNDEIARQIAERLYPEEALKARLAAFEKAGKELLVAINTGTEIAAAMRQMEDLLGVEDPVE